MIAWAGVWPKKAPTGAGAVEGWAASLRLVGQGGAVGLWIAELPGSAIHDYSIRATEKGFDVNQ